MNYVCIPCALLFISVPYANMTAVVENGVSIFKDLSFK